MERRQLILFGAVFALVLAVLAGLYVAFLRPGYAVLYDNIREADAAEIVAVLDKQGIEYRLEDEGHRVLVPRDEVGRARVLVAGSGAAMGGVVGFELFNETDMGLTEFAQKVNYQRALQGELARTIMSMDGIAFARVHLSLPERSLFRANQPQPKAAVTLQTQYGAVLDAGRVTGIQELVSAAVTGLQARDVAVLDHRGHLLSPLPVDGAEDTGPLDERSALEEYYRARTRGVAEKLIPGIPFDIWVTAIPNGDDAPGDGAAEDGEAPQARNFQLRIALRTEAELGEEDRDMLRRAIADAAGLEPKRGDSLRFETGQIGDYPPANEAPAAAAMPQASPPPPLAANAAPSGRGIVSGVLASGWFWAALALLAVLGLIMLRRRSRMSADEQQSFAEMLGESLTTKEGLAHGR